MLTRSDNAASTATLHRPLILLVLCLGTLIAQIDTSVVNLAIQPIGVALDMGLAAQQWVVDGYNLAYALFLLSGGLIADLYGRRKSFAIGISVFVLGCLVCGLAVNSALLIVGRIVSGLGAAMIVPASLAILRVVWHDPIARGRALGFWAGCNGLAFAFGPTLGGFLISLWGWRAVFLIVLPFGIAALLLARLYVPESADPRDRHFDLAGQMAAAIFLGGLAIIAIEGRQHPWIILVCAPVLLIAAVCFIRFERRAADQALIPLSLFGIKPFTGAVTATAAMTFGMYGLLFLLPLAWQTGSATRAAFTPVQTGLALIPMALAFFMVSQYSGRLGERAGISNMIVGGTALIGFGLIIVAGSAFFNGGFWPIQCGLLLSGIGMGLNTGPLMAVAVAVAPPQRAGTVSALINVARMVGATLGVAVLGSLYAMSNPNPDQALSSIAVPLAVGAAVQLLGAIIARFYIEGRELPA